MASDDEDGALEQTDPFPTPPGITTQPVGPLGVPVPVPDMDSPGPVDPPEPPEEPEEPSEGEEGPIGTDGTDDLREAAQVGENYLDRVEEAIDKETCGFCASVLRELRGRPLEEQVQGVRELAVLKEQVAANPDKETVEAAMDDFEVLDDPSEFL